MIITECPTCKDDLPEYPEIDWKCSCGRCYCYYLSGRYLGIVGEE